jgi:hypothetical protein
MGHYERTTFHSPQVLAVGQLLLLTLFFAIRGKQVPDQGVNRQLVTDCKTPVLDGDCIFSQDDVSQDPSWIIIGIDVFCGVSYA